jgi:hypothetical protein
VSSLSCLGGIDIDIQSVTPENRLSLLEARGLATIHVLLDQAVKVIGVEDAGHDGP